MTNTQMIQQVYAAFGRGDVNAILQQCAEDVDWRNDGVASKECPWNANFSGTANVPRFFTEVAKHLDLSVFDPHTFVESGNHVAVRLRIEGRVKRNGGTWQNDAVHFWTFNSQQKITQYRHFNDTAAELAAWRG